MHRFLNNYQLQGNESPYTSEYNWDDISIGNDSLAADKFFGFKRPEAKDSNENLNNADFNLDDNETEEVESNENLGHNENHRNDTENTPANSVDSSLDENQSQRPQPRKVSKPLTTHNPKVFNVVLAGKIYEEKKKIRMEMIEKREREQRKFHAKPAPNFNSIHAHQKRASEAVNYTIPTTPKVVHHHRKNMEKVKIKLMELELARKPKPFVSRDADVLFKPPFKPQIEKKVPVEQVPFKLQSDERLRERRMFDEQIRLQMEHKEREREERQKAEDEEIRKEVRKGTVFKANPNPFH